jgi:hypothetical protein
LIVALSRASAVLMSTGNDSRARQALYFIRQSDERWFVFHSGAEYPYQTRHIAIEAAVDAANTSGKRGHHSQVLVCDELEDWRPIWTYGHDPYPWSGE